VYAARSGTTDHPQVRAVMRARMINNQLGGAFFTPWDVDQLDDTWLNVFYGLTDLPNMKKNYTNFEKKLQEARRKHPTYRKYLN
jgi:hypothetical protein